MIDVKLLHCASCGKGRTSLRDALGLPSSSLCLQCRRMILQAEMRLQRVLALDAIIRGEEHKESRTWTVEEILRREA